jgi:hypothetical protein
MLNDTPTSQRNRGISSTFDFMVAFVILVSAVGLFLGSGISYLDAAGAEDSSENIAAQRAADRLTDDLLADQPLDSSLDTDCTRKFFAKDTSSCGFKSTWTSGSTDYLENVFKLDASIHVKITDRNGNPASLSGTTLTIGDQIPSNGDTLYKWNRLVGLDTDGDSTLEWNQLTVYVWT